MTADLFFPINVSNTAWLRDNDCCVCVQLLGGLTRQPCSKQFVSNKNDSSWDARKIKSKLDSSLLCLKTPTCVFANPYSHLIKQRLLCNLSVFGFPWQPHAARLRGFWSVWAAAKHSWVQHACKWKKRKKEKVRNTCFFFKSKTIIVLIQYFNGIVFKLTFYVICFYLRIMLQHNWRLSIYLSIHLGFGIKHWCSTLFYKNKWVKINIYRV